MPMKEGNLVEAIFLPWGRRIAVPSGVTILEAAQEAGLRIRTVCGGVGECGKCKMVVREGEVSIFDRRPVEEYITKEELARGYTLSCRTRIKSDVKVYVPAETRIKNQKMVSEALIPPHDLDPSIKKALIKIGTSIPENLTLMLNKQLVEKLGKPVKSLTEEMEEEILGNLKKGGRLSTLAVTPRDGSSEVLFSQLGDTTGENYGVALDVGTTKIVAYLVDLNKGEILEMDADYNDQMVYGEEILSRIKYSKSKGGLAKLQEAVVGSINRLIDGFVERKGISRENIVEITAAGNTVMNHLLMGEDSAYLADENAMVSRKPFETMASSLGISVNKRAPLYCVPNVSRYLGGDAVADVLATRAYESEEVSLIVDMGTNGEIMIGKKGWVLSCSCASGPAFEGYGISNGMRATEGAIETIRIEPETLDLKYTVIGNTKPLGICGSGIVDLLAEMYRAKLVNRWAKFVPSRSEKFREGPHGVEFCVVPSSETAIGRDIVFTERDLKYLIDSKAALCASIAVLIRKLGASPKDVQHLYLSGAFGNYINIESLTQVGGIPELPNAKIHKIYNGAIAGAYLTLISRKERRDVEKIANITIYYDLTTDPIFVEEYQAALSIPGSQDLFPSSLRGEGGVLKEEKLMDLLGG